MVSAVQNEPIVYQERTAQESATEFHTRLHFRIKKLGTIVIMTLGTSLVVASIITGSLAALCIIPIAFATGTASACTAVIIIGLWRKMTPAFPAPLKRASQLVQAVADEILAIIACKLLYLLNLERFDPKKGAPIINRNEVPVLFIHGFISNSSCWVYHRRRLQEEGFRNIFTINLGNPLLSISDYGEKVRAKVQEICDISGREEKDVILVGHSMGGLVAREFLYHHNRENVHVRKIITIGSPLQGTIAAWLAAWLCKCAKEMIPGSSTLQDLEEQEQKDIRTRLYRVASSGDFLIYPQESAKGQQPKEGQQITITELEATGHAGELFSDTVGDILVDEIKKEQATVLNPGCYLSSL